MIAVIEDAVRHYAKETGALLDACRQLVEYYGTDEELASFEASSARPLFLLDALVSVAAGLDVDAVTASPPRAKVVCTEPMAVMLTPLLRIIADSEPNFTNDARELLSADECRKLLVHYGVFIGESAMHLCEPIWSAYPSLTRKPTWPGLGPRGPSG